MTGIPWMEESGMLASIIGITNTHQVGLVRDALVGYSINNGYAERWVLPVVAETYDGFLNDIDAFHLNKEHVFQAIASASSGVPAEGGDQRQLLLPVLLPHRRMLPNSSRLLIDAHRPDVNRSLLTIGPTAFG